MACTYLALDRSCFLIVAIGRSAQRRPWGRRLRAIPTGDASPFGKILFALRLPDLDLLLLATAAQLFWLELPLGFELGAAMLWNVAFGHVEGCELEVVNEW